jgi:hypothetical protein
MPEEADWILQGNYFDASLLRNYFALALSRATDRYAPRMRFSELFLAESEGDFRYWGVYALMEKIKRDANRVNIKKLSDVDNSEPNISGGYLLQLDRVKEGDLYFDTARGSRLLYEYPKGEDITPTQAAWIQDYLNDFEAALYGPDFQDPSLGYQAFLGTESMVDFFLLNEVLKNVDAFQFSTFLFKDRGGKLQMGPVWDFDLAMGNSFGVLPEGWLLCEARWIDRLREDPAFLEAAINRYRELRLGAWGDAALDEMIEGALAELDGAAQRNTQKWYRNLGFSYQDRAAALRAWLEARLAWVDSNIDTLCDE